MFYEDIDGDGVDEIVLVIWSKDSNPDETRMEVIDPLTWSLKAQSSLTLPVRYPVLLDMDRDGRSEILTVNMPDEIVVYDHTLKISKRTRFGFQIINLLTVPDTDGDGMAEIVLRSHEGNILLNTDSNGLILHHG